MSKLSNMTSRQEAEEYELQPPASPSSPLLPSYTSHIDQRSSSPPLSSSSGIKTRSSQSRRPPRSRACFAIAILCAVVIPSVLTTALVGIVSGQGKNVLEGLKNLEGVPQDVKDWLEGVGKGYAGVGDQGMFPTNIGYAGPTPTGKEPGLLATAPSQPHHTAISPLLPPTPHNHHPKTQIQNLWGNLSPYHSVTHGLGDTSSLIPKDCELIELHWLQRHGARYPTSVAGGPADFGGKLKAMKGWKAKGDLGFLNDWEWSLGAEVLTPFGREQLFDLGVAARVKYGFLLDKMEGRLPVFRTESQDRMLKSAQNFAAGFFGIPAEDQYNLEVTIEAPGFNNTLAPWNTCYNADWNSTGVRDKLHAWDEIYLKDARKRLQKDIRGIELTIQDVRMMMDVCPYETVSLGYSSFCSLFTEKEWKGYEYRWDLYWWWSSSFGLPSAKAQGLGWAQELVSRLTHTRLTVFDSTTNSSFHNDVQFPLNDAIYIDFTHDTQFALLLPTLNLTSFAAAGPLPSDHIPKHRTFIASEIMPFATNMQIQVLQCGVMKGKDVNEDKPGGDDTESENEQGQANEQDKDDQGQEEGLPTRVQNRTPSPRAQGEKKVRIILNDGVVPLTGIRGCGEDEDGLCPFDAFVDSVKELIGEVDFAKECRHR